MQFDQRVFGGLAVGAALGMQAFPSLNLGAYSIFFSFFMNFVFRIFCLEFSFFIVRLR